MKVEYNDRDCALRLGKMKYDEARIKCSIFCPLIRAGNKIWLDLTSTIYLNLTSILLGSNSHLTGSLSSLT